MNACASWPAIKRRLASGKERQIPKDCETNLISTNKVKISKTVLGNIGYTSTSRENIDFQQGSLTQSQLPNSNLPVEIIDGTIDH